jgi:hypothetical protein
MPAKRRSGHVQHSSANLTNQFESALACAQSIGAKHAFATDPPDVHRTPVRVAKRRDNRAGREIYSAKCFSRLREAISRTNVYRLQIGDKRRPSTHTEQVDEVVRPGDRSHKGFAILPAASQRYSDRQNLAA